MEDKKSIVKENQNLKSQLMVNQMKDLINQSLNRTVQNKMILLLKDG